MKFSMWCLMKTLLFVKTIARLRSGEDIEIRAKNMERSSPKEKFLLDETMQTKLYSQLRIHRTILTQDYLRCYWLGFSVCLWVKAECLLPKFLGPEGVCISGVTIFTYYTQTHAYDMSEWDRKLAMRFICFIYTLYTWSGDDSRLVGV